MDLLFICQLLLQVAAYARYCAPKLSSMESGPKNVYFLQAVALVYPN